MARPLQFDGKLNFRVTDEMREQLEAAAKREGLAIGDVIRLAITAWLKKGRGKRKSVPGV